MKTKERFDIDTILPTPNPVLGHVIDLMEREMLALGETLADATQEGDVRAADRCIAQRRQFRALIDQAKAFQENA